MKCFSLLHLEDHDVRKGLLAAVPVERSATAAVLAHLAEFDARQLYRDQSCSSMFVYCVRELGYSEDGAGKRIQAARVAREFPVLFEAVADGRLHLSGVCLLAPKLTAENVDELIAVAARRSKAEIEYLLAARFPKSSAKAAVLTESADSQEKEHAPGHVEGDAGCEGAGEDGPTAIEGDLGALLAGTASSPARARRDRITPISADAYALEATLDQESYDLLRQIQALQGRGVPAHDIAGVIKRGLRLLAGDLLKRKLGAGSGQPRGSKDPYYVSPAVKRAVWKRDDGRCTFRGDNDKCCGETHDVEFDHIVPPSRGGDGSVSNVRLRCHTHNQREAEKLYGERFMREKREAAKARSDAARAEGEADARARGEQRAAEQQLARERRDAAREQREAEREQREAERAARRAEREQDRAAREAEREQDRAARDERRDQQRAAREAQRDQQRAARVAERERDRAARDERRDQQRAAREAQREQARLAREAAAGARAKLDELVPALMNLGCSRAEALHAAAQAAHVPDAPLAQRLRLAIRSLGPRSSRRSA